jgi:hypothetical protein
MCGGGRGITAVTPVRHRGFALGTPVALGTLVADVAWHVARHEPKRTSRAMTASAIEVSNAYSSPTAAAPVTGADHHGFSFRDFLSAINPLQYLPVVGTIYRAMTGDVIPEPLRQAGSLLVSGLMGGPIGLMTSIAVTLAEKITGVDPEKIVAAQFHRLVPTAAVPEVVQAAAQPVTIGPVSTTSARFAMTPAQLAAYGVQIDTSGTMRLGDIKGADVLNAIELGRHTRAATAYAANQVQF